MNIKVLPRTAIERGSFDEECCIISIHGTSIGPAEISKEIINVREILVLEFDDVDESTRPESLFNVNKAKRILEFVSKNQGVPIILVHCLAGVSRSAAVAAAILKIYTGDDSEIFNNPKYIPNMLVYRTIMETYQSHQ